MIRLGAILCIIGAVAGWVLAGVRTVGEPQVPELDVPPAGEPLTGIPERAEFPAVVEQIAESKRRASFTELADFITSIEQASAGDCRRWWKQMEGASLESRKILLQRWATLDPEGAHAVLVRDEEFTTFANSLLSAWAAHDVEGAMDVALGMEKGHEIYTVMRNAGSEQIEKLHALLLERGYDQTSPHKFASIFHHLADADPAKAATLALEFKGGVGSFDVGLENVMNRWLERDSAAALAWAEGIDKPAARKRAIEMLAREWLERDPLAAMDAMGDKDDFRRGFMATHVIRTGSMNQADFERLLARAGEIEDADPALAPRLYRAMIAGLGEGEHPERLAALAPHFNAIDPEQLKWGVKAVVKTWAKSDEDGLVEFINSVENETVRSAAIRGLVSQLSNDEPLRALEFLADFDEPVSGIDARALMGGAVASGLSPDEVLKQLPPAVRDEAVGSFAGGRQSYLTRAEVAEFLNQQPTGTHRDRAVMNLAGDWAANEPQAAAAWVGGMEPGSIQVNAAGNIAASWATVDIAAAVAWAGSLEDDESRSRALANAARITASTDPLRSLDIADQIGEGNARNEALVAGLRALARQDPDLALGTAEKYDDAVQSKVLTAIEEARSLRELLEK